MAQSGPSRGEQLKPKAGRADDFSLAAQLALPGKCVPCRLATFNCCNVRSFSPNLRMSLRPFCAWIWHDAPSP